MMDIATVGGIVIAVGALLVAMVMDGGHLSALLNTSAFLIVIVGTIGVTLASHSLSDAFGAIRLLSRALKEPRDARSQRTKELMEFSLIARREGLLALEGKGADDEFINHGLAMIVDGANPEVVANVLNANLMARQDRFKRHIAFFDAAGGYAPTMGIIGTVMGLVHVLGNLADPDKLGEAIAVAFLATLYGIASANIVWLPIATKLRYRAEEERGLYEMTIEGLLGLQEGLNPHVLQQYLNAFSDNLGHDSLANRETGGEAAPQLESAVG